MVVTIRYKVPEFIAIKLYHYHQLLYCDCSIYNFWNIQRNSIEVQMKQMLPSFVGSIVVRTIVWFYYINEMIISIFRQLTIIYMFVFHIWSFHTTTNSCLWYSIVVGFFKTNIRSNRRQCVNAPNLVGLRTPPRVASVSCAVILQPPAFAARLSATSSDTSRTSATAHATSCA